MFYEGRISLSEIKIFVITEFQNQKREIIYNDDEVIHSSFSSEKRKNLVGAECERFLIGARSQEEREIQMLKNQRMRNFHFVLLKY